jgi:hypothetical protein
VCFLFSKRTLPLPLALPCTLIASRFKYFTSSMEGSASRSMGKVSSSAVAIGRWSPRVLCTRFAMLVANPGEFTLSCYPRIGRQSPSSGCWLKAIRLRVSRPSFMNTTWAWSVRLFIKRASV